jgi:hypothetical protein
MGHEGAESEQEATSGPIGAGKYLYLERALGPGSEHGQQQKESLGQPAPVLSIEFARVRYREIE